VVSFVEDTDSVVLDTILVTHVDHALAFTYEVHPVLSIFVVRVVLVNDGVLRGGQLSAELVY
jgi:hypothetical protein